MQKFNSLDECRLYWHQLVTAWQESGLTQAEFARRRKVSIKSLSYWVRHNRKLLISKVPKLADAQAVDVPQAHLVSLDHLVDATPKKPSTRTLILRIGRKFRIVIPAGFCPATLGKLVQTLEQLP
jgi:transcriptional regulator with XRE-family HTH domain